MGEEIINKFLRDVINLILISPGYMKKANQYGAPRPIGEYGNIALLIKSTMGIDQSELVNNTADQDITENIKGVRASTMSANFYRGSAIDNADRVRIGLRRQSIVEIFSSAGIGLGAVSDIRNIPEPISDGWEERAQMDIDLNYIDSDSDIIASILSVDMAGEFQSRGLKYNSIIGVSQ